jgi:5-methylcytosine-specific restriction endonuclease McrA
VVSVVNSEEVIRSLVLTKRWSRRTASAFVRAGHRCEYCGLDFLASVEALKQMEVDHIVPKTKGGEASELENLAIACRHCNTHLKRDWDPRTVAGPTATREELVRAVRERLFQVRQRRLGWLKRVRVLVGYRGNEA